MVAHPSSFDADFPWDSASAYQDIAFNLVDLDYRHVFLCDERYSLKYLVGIRYAEFSQSFRSQFESIISGNVNTDVNFDGAGFRLGLEGEHTRRATSCSSTERLQPVSWAANSAVAISKAASNDPVIAETTWKEARFVSILDCEVGVGWTGCNGHVKASAGYMMSGWLNAVKSAEIHLAVQANQYHGPDKVDGSALVFDGFVGRLEAQW